MGDEERMLELAALRGREYLEMVYDLRGYAKEKTEFLRDQALFGFRVRQEVRKNMRIEIDQRLRAVRMAVSDPKERAEYIKATAPKLLPDLRARPEK